MDFKYGACENSPEVVTLDQCGQNKEISLQEKVIRLEEKVQEQEDQITCLHTSVAEIFRKLSFLEVVNNSNLTLPRSLTSKSHVNLSFNDSMLPATISTPSLVQNGQYDASLKANMSKFSKHKHNRPDSEEVRNNVNDTFPRFPKGTTGLPYKIYQKNTKMNSSANKLIAGKSDITKTVKVKGRSFSSCGDKPFFINKSKEILGEGSRNSTSREPSFSAEENLLRLYIGGRCINLHAPSFSSNSLNSTKNGNDNATLTADTNEEKHQQNGSTNDNNCREKVRSTERYDADNDDAKVEGDTKHQLKLEWIYGYRGRDCRSNLHYLPTGELAYNLGLAIVLFNREESCQRHFLDHTSDVKCIAVHPNRLLLASGQSKAIHFPRNSTTASGCPNGAEDTLDPTYFAHVRIWDSIKLRTVRVLGASHFDKHPCCLSFSKTNGGTHLAVVDDTIDHPFSIWDWQHNKKIAETKTGNEQVLACEFHPSDKQLIITCGKNHVTLWNFSNDILHKKSTIYEGKDRPKYFLCIAFGNNGQIYTGDSSGMIRMWNSITCKVLKQSNKSHDGPIFALCQLKNSDKLMSGGGKDGAIMQWDQDLNHGCSIKIPPTWGPIRTICQCKNEFLAVGTIYNHILHGSLQSPFCAIMESHWDDITALSVDPEKQQFLTCSADKTIRLWDTLSKSCVWSMHVDDSVECLCIHPTNQVFVAGCQFGRWHIIQLNNREFLIKKVDGVDTILCADYSSSGQYLALGSANSNIYIYSCNGKRYDKIGICTVKMHFLLFPH